MAGCCELWLEAELLLPSAAQVALEDYARELVGASAATLVPGAGASRVRGVHLCGTASPPADSVRADVLAFARDLAARGGDGLGWS